MEFCCNFYLFYWMASLGVIFEATSAATQGFCIDHGYTPKNGRRTPLANPGQAYFSGSLIRYSCNEYFELQPYIPTQECVKNGTLGYMWTPGAPPKCFESVRCPNPVIRHGSYDKEVYHEGDKLLVTCDNGYTLMQQSAAKCLETGQWSYLPTCKENSCPKPPLIENGFYNFYPNIYNDGGLPPESHVVYTCNEGYQLEPVSQAQRKCREGHWSGADPKCVREGCDPPQASYGDYIPKRPHYDVHDTLTYLCQGNHDVTRSCQRDHTWSGTACPEALTTVQMPDTSSQVYCKRPLAFSDHLNVKCCVDDAIYSATLDDAEFCCPERGLVEFVCDVGFFISGQANQWMCSSGNWVAVSSDHFETVSDPPKCTRNGTRGDTGGVTGDMLKPVFGTAAGVLVLLTAAIIIAFCRPKLIDMKRRWRELREDEDELIIDGRRILLPSYEEAVTSQDPYQQQQPCTSSSQSPSTNCDDPGPSCSQQRTLNRNDSSSSSNTSEEQSRPSCSSDEEMLVPDPVNKGLENGGSSSRPQSLILKAGTSIDACVVINPPPCEQSKLEESSKERSIPSLFPQASNSSMTCESFSDLKVEDDPMLDLGNDTEVDLESIFPATPPETSSKIHIRPIVSNDGSHLLSYPLVSDNNPSCNQQFTIHIDSNGTSFDSNDSPTRTDEKCCMDIPAENTAHASKENYDQDEDSHLALQSTDQIHIVMSSQTAANHASLDEMGSTAV